MISYAETIRTLNPTASILHLSGYVGRSGMGISSVVLGLMGAQTSMGADTQIWSCDNDASVAQVCQDFNQPRSAIVTYPTVGPARLCFSPSMLRAIGGEAGERFGVVHQHGMWQACSAAVNRWRARYQRPTVLAPHGSLEAYALGRSRLKKQLASLLYESRNVRSATCLHATAAAEVRSFRDFGAKNDIALIPNGVSEQWLSASGDAERFRRKYSVPLDKRVLFFLSRVTPKKGLPMLLGAIGDHRQRLRDWMLIIAGNGEFGHREELEAQASALGITGAIAFLGPLFGQDKRDAFAATDVFVLPSHSEGSPMAVLDALAAGVPVLTTRMVPWEDLTRHDCGWWVPADRNSLGDALVDISSRSRQDLATLGARGRKLVAEQYSWRLAASRSLRLYAWLQGLADKPDFVI